MSDEVAVSRGSKGARTSRFTVSVTPGTFGRIKVMSRLFGWSTSYTCNALILFGLTALEDDVRSSAPEDWGPLREFVYGSDVTEDDVIAAFENLQKSREGSAV
jgi:hypothetical protein